MTERIGKYTLHLKNKPSIISSAAVVGKKEGEGPLCADFDAIHNDSKLGANSWEEAESLFQKEALDRAMGKIGLECADIGYVFAGDLLDQCIGSSFGLKDKNIPLIGLYGACSTMALSMSMASIFANGNLAKYVAAVTSSHYCSSERQFRFPLEYGGQRPPSAQWTVTGAGAVILSQHQNNLPSVEHITIGKIVDLGVTDQNNMGGAMAPAAADTIKNYLSDTCTTPDDYDMIFTGDLGSVGSSLLYDLLKLDNIDLRSHHKDCGLMIFSQDQTDVLAGGSGCGCSASVFSSHILRQMKEGRLKNILFVATGALLSPTSVLQRETVPAIAHLLHITV